MSHVCRTLRTKCLSIGHRYLYFATEERKNDPDYHASEPEDQSMSDDPQQAGEDTEGDSESEDKEDPTVDPESESWILPRREDASSRRPLRRIEEGPESDPESEQFELGDEDDPYDFGVLSASDNDAQSPATESEQGELSRQAVRVSRCPIFGRSPHIA